MDFLRKYVSTVKMCIHCQDVYSLSRCVFTVKMCIHCQDVYSLSRCVFTVKMCIHCQDVYSLSRCVFTVKMCIHCQCFECTGILHTWELIVLVKILLRKCFIIILLFGVACGYVVFASGVSPLTFRHVEVQLLLANLFLASTR